jgi:hypothetical protein
MMTEQAAQVPYEQALARFRRGYFALFALVDDFPEERRDLSGACGEWTPRQVLAHLCGWLEEAENRVVQILAGDRISRQYDDDSDYAAFNAASVSQREDVTWDGLIVELKQRSDAFYEAAKVAGAAGLADDPRVCEWVVWLWHDCVEHMGQLSRFALVGLPA